MRGRAWSVVGIVMALAGAVFTLQGIGVLGGSSMSGSTTWAILGPVIAVAGLIVYARSTRES
jgi:hypothetical protein